MIASPERSRASRRASAAALAALGLLTAGCAGKPAPQGSEPILAERTQTERDLQALPPPSEPIVVAIYDIADKTGQHKPNDEFSEFSRAVTQGATEMLLEALQEAGRGQWFVILDRKGLNNVLRERQLIRSTREQFLGEDGQPLGPPPPLLYAPILIEGAVVAYETNTYTGGAGARFLGIGANTRYEHDRVTVSLRVTSTQSGRMLRSVSATKNIYSQGTQAGVFRFVDFDELLEGEIGVSVNEPPQLAVRRAIEKAVYGLVIEGSLSGLWSFADPQEALPLVESYVEERDGYVSQTLAAAPSPGTLAPDRTRLQVREPEPESPFSSEIARRLREAAGVEEDAAEQAQDAEPNIYVNPENRQTTDTPPPNRSGPG
ncbi:CsgG/HfaB family protein [Erythrobacter sp.]|jgi:curli production assembly/transport component CsgG|uniref:CsgG/HfaB family protein n=1 Tax=Erythrobacter sp. TaxID=1042 RepID=UPI002EC579F1|nr:CsgG/HfaB family protein [Erythrobacter sp.]